MPQVDIITGEARHRTWTLEEKLSILDAALRAWTPPYIKGTRSCVPHPVH